jgi:hypothetical protein
LISLKATPMLHVITLLRKPRKDDLSYDQINDRISKLFGANCYRGGKRVWFVSSYFGARELSDLIGARNGGPINSALVSQMVDYAGCASLAMWEWLKARLERPLSPDELSHMDEIKRIAAGMDDELRSKG